ncbi:MAG: ABC-2 transporter permease [Frisingicoccus sp.]|nr:ABC-2 transporter permease [Frisingicoccus sp.]
MSGLLFKEFYTLKRYIVSYGAVLVMFVFISVYMKSAAYLQAMLAMSLGMLTFTGMTYDKMYGWDKMVLTMPVSRGTVVRSKYITSVLVAGASLAVSTLIGIVMMQFVPMEDGLAEMGVTAMVLFGVLMFAYAIILPLIYKFGVEKARIFMVAAIMVPIIILVSVAKYIPAQIVQYLDEHFLFSSIIFIAAAFICYVISYFISVRIYSQKEY